MSDDKLLETLGKAAREQARDDPLDDQFDALSRGDLSEEQIEALAAKAAEGVVPPDSVEAFRPLGDDFRRTVAARAARKLAESISDESVGPSGSAAAPIAFPARRPGRRSQMNFAPVALAASVMLAVGIGFFAMPRSGFEPIPGYSMQLQGASTSRSAAQAVETAVFRSGDRFELRLTPKTAVRGSVAARIYIGTPDGLMSLATPPAVLAPSGAIRIVGTTGADVALPAGESRLYVVLGREDALPNAQDLSIALATDDSATGRGWSAWRIPVSADL